MGQLGSNLGNPNVVNPNQAKFGDLDASEKGARFLAQGTRGLAQGFQNYQQQGQAMRGFGGAPQINPMMQQNVDSSYFLPQQKQGPNNLAFYGGSY